MMMLRIIRLLGFVIIVITTTTTRTTRNSIVNSLIVVDAASTNNICKRGTNVTYTYNVCNENNIVNGTYMYKYRGNKGCFQLCVTRPNWFRIYIQRWKCGVCSPPIPPQNITCFNSNAELREAVINYINDPTNTTVRQYYGNPMNIWCVRFVNDLSYVFYNISTFNEDISVWDVSLATNMSNMFAYATTFNKRLNYWNTSSVVDYTNMFYNASSFNQDISVWNFSSSTKTTTTPIILMNSMFTNAKLFRRNLCSWGTKLSNTTVDVTNMFRNTNCPNTSDPILTTTTSTKPGPFCYKC